MEIDKIKEMTAEEIPAVEEPVVTPVIKRIYKHTPHKKSNRREDMIKISRRINRA